MPRRHGIKSIDNFFLKYDAKWLSLQKKQAQFKSYAENFQSMLPNFRQVPRIDIGEDIPDKEVDMISALAHHYGVRACVYCCSLMDGKNAGLSSKDSELVVRAMRNNDLKFFGAPPKVRKFCTAHTSHLTASASYCASATLKTMYSGCSL